jgi:putative ABC transport system permease protein
MAIRAALGAGRLRLIRQLLTESVLLALGGGIGGLVLGLWGSSLLASLRTQVDIPLSIDFGMDWRVFAYSFVAALLTGIVVGIVPALRGSRADVSAVLHSRSGDVIHGAGRRGLWRFFSYSFLSARLKGALVAALPVLRSKRDGGGSGLYEGGRSVTAGRERQRLRNFLVVGQLAGSMVLLIVAGLFVRSLQQAQRMSLGFDPDHVLNISMDPNEVGYDDARGKTFYRELETRVRALPGVESASLAFSIPLGFNHQTEKLAIEGKPVPEGEQAPEIVYNTVDPPYFQTMRIRILRGRAFTDADDETSPRVAIINETMAKRFWPNEDPIGKQFNQLKFPGKPVEVVGVAQDGRYLDPTDPPDPYFFVPFAQQYISYQTLQIRTALPPESLIPEIERQVRALDPNLPVFDARTMRTALNGVNGYFIFQLGAGLAAIMGLLGLVLAVVGVYGVVSYSAGQRTQEIGIRVAMGAQRSDILRMVLNQGSVLVGVGLVVGLVAAAVLTRTISSLLVGVSPMDPLTFAAVSIVLSLVALTACYIPALRATRVDPLTALHYE